VCCAAALITSTAMRHTNAKKVGLSQQGVIPQGGVVSLELGLSLTSHTAVVANMTGHCSLLHYVQPDKPDRYQYGLTPRGGGGAA
jgi:hypothetical protein